MTIKVLGSGCSKCKKLEENVKSVLAETGHDASVEKVEDFKEIMKYGVMQTPALVIDEKVVSVGKVLKEKDIKAFL